MSCPAAPVNDCCFCMDSNDRRIVQRLGSVFAILDANPVTAGHVLIIPRRHVVDYFEMTAIELQEADLLIRRMKDDISRKDDAVSGFNIGVNCGAAAGQTVMHAHIHLIPRRRGDTADPRGGVRGVVPAKMSY